MTIKLPDGQEIAVDKEGFMVNPAIWNEEIARHLAKLEGVEELTEEHWAVIKYIRDHYLKNDLAPMIRSICKTTRLPLKKIYTLFPAGPAKGACKWAGLPKPDGCV
ncbi:MAG: TusE/DsrC/DsvC family sulfur relay protein [Planctomycetes bacterium]|nr:TusE/DsrC/DsvC family sulfur relay protein [Planctomycetota bacterium]